MVGLLSSMLRTMFAKFRSIKEHDGFPLCYFSLVFNVIFSSL